MQGRRLVLDNILRLISKKVEDKYCLYEKSAAISWNPLNWGKRSEETGNVYDWSDLWKGIRAAAAQTGRSFARAGTGLARGAATIVGSDSAVDAINDFENEISDIYDDWSGGKDMALAYRQSLGGRTASRALELGSGTFAGGIAGPVGFAASTAAMRAGTRPDVALVPDDKGYVHAVKADPVYKVWDNVTAFTPSTWAGNFVGTMARANADSRIDGVPFVDRAKMVGKPSALAAAMYAGAKINPIAAGMFGLGFLGGSGVHEQAVPWARDFYDQYQNMSDYRDTLVTDQPITPHSQN